MAYLYKRISWLLLLLFLLPKAYICEEADTISVGDASKHVDEESRSANERERSPNAEVDDDDNENISDSGPPGDLKTVELDQGLLKGMLEKSTNGELFYGFYGIPYAKPPVDELRFKDPVAHEGWDGVRDATVMPPACPQIDINNHVASGKSHYSGEEDCLFLNVFHPADIDDIEKPVLVFFHGGAFASGSAADYEPYDFMNEDVVLVVLQFRLGILGFSSTEDLVMPGNLGLKDQMQALRWIQENIDQFGGDPLRVSLFGEGSGAVSVHYQILSHHSIGLFSRAILQSGTAICPWAQGGVHRKAVERLADIFKCTKKDDDSEVEEQSKELDNETEETVEEKGEKETENVKTREEDDPEEKQRKSEEMLKCLQGIETQKLAEAIKPFFALTYFPIIFGPLIDERFLPETPDFLLNDARHKRLELIIGIARDAGSFITNAIFSSEAKRMLFKYEFPFAAPLSMEYTDNDIAPLNMSIKVFDRYVGSLKFDADDAMNLTKLYTDRHLTVCSDLTALMHSENNKNKKKNVFFYELQHKGSRSFNDVFDLSFGKEWISQGDELFYLFPMKSNEAVEHDENDKKLKDIMIKMWTNFAQLANPTPDDSLGFIWEPFTADAPNHLVLKPEPYMEEDSRKEIREFWTSLPTQQNLLLFKDKIQNLQQWNSSETKAENQEETQESQGNPDANREKSESIDERTTEESTEVQEEEDGVSGENSKETLEKINDEL